MSNELTLTAAWKKLQDLGDRKPAYSIAQANVKGYFDVLGKDERWYRLSSRGHNKFTVRKI